MSNPPPGGEQWNAENAPYRAAIENAARTYGVPVSVLLNMGRMESDWRSGLVTEGSNATGLFQITPGLRRDMERAWGITINPLDPVQNINAAARGLYEHATRTGIGQVAPIILLDETGHRMRDANGDYVTAHYSVQEPNWVDAVGGWHAGRTGYAAFQSGLPSRDAEGNRIHDVGPVNLNYVPQITQNIIPYEQLPDIVRNAFENGGGVRPIVQPHGIGSDVDIPLGIGPRTDLPSPDSGTTGSYADIETRLGLGPSGILGEAAPWVTGRIGEDFGRYLQVQGDMPANLLFNQETRNWYVPEGAQPGTWGAWGTPAVENWIGQNQGLGTQALQDIAGQYRFDITPGPSGTVSEHPIGGVADPSTYAPIHVWGGDLGNWRPADPSSTWGTPNAVSPYVGWQAGQQDLFFNPNTGNWGTPASGAPGGLGSWDPTGGYVGPGGFSAVAPGGSTVDYQHYFDTMELPSGGFEGGGEPDPEGGLTMSSTFPTPPGGYGSPIPAPTPAPTPVYYNSGIGPGGITIASGINTTPIMTYGNTVGGITLAPGSTNGVFFS